MHSSPHFFEEALRESKGGPSPRRLFVCVETAMLLVNDLNGAASAVKPNCRSALRADKNDKQSGCLMHVCACCSSSCCKLKKKKVKHFTQHFLKISQESKQSVDRGVLEVAHTFKGFQRRRRERVSIKPNRCFSNF